MSDNYKTKLKQLLPRYDPSDDLREVEESWLEVLLKFFDDEVHHDEDIWSRAAEEQDAAWKERDMFLDALEARGPAATPEQAEQDLARFKEITKHCNAKSKAIFERAMGRYPPTN